MPIKETTYLSSGVDIEKGDKFTAFLARKSKHIGGFSALCRVKGTADIFAAASTDGVGTKLKLAMDRNRHDSIGIDLVAMCVNDVITCGAEPAFFLDYYATGKLELKTSKEIMKGILKGCSIAGCDLVGGETAEMPGFYKKGEYDLAGFAVGFVKKSDIIDGRRIRPGDIVIGLPSSGFHSNGYSLIRKIFAQGNLLKKHAKELLKPTKIYVKDVKKLRSALRKKKSDIKGMAHITGGGIEGNLARILPGNVKAVIYADKWRTPPIMKKARKIGNIPEREMWKTFNMGIGMAAVVPPEGAETALRALKNAKIIGEITRGKGGVEIIRP